MNPAQREELKRLLDAATPEALEHLDAITLKVDCKNYDPPYGYIVRVTLDEGEFLLHHARLALDTQPAAIRELLEHCEALEAAEGQAETNREVTTALMQAEGENARLRAHLENASRFCSCEPHGRAKEPIEAHEATCEFAIRAALLATPASAKDTAAVLGKVRCALSELHDEVIEIQGKGARGWDSHLASACADARAAIKLLDSLGVG